jgi:hypothetical protein
MAGDLLSIDQIAEMCGRDAQYVTKALRKGDLIDQTPSQVALWLQGAFEVKIAKQGGRREKRKDRATIVHRKWD